LAPPCCGSCQPKSATRRDGDGDGDGGAGDETSRVDIVAQLTVLQEILTHHAREEEEKDLLPEVRSLFPRAQRVAMGGEMESLRMALTKGPAPFLAEAVLVG
jgi:hypothetical protein